jgi:hypothetical protein
VIASDAARIKAACTKLAAMPHDSLARTLAPVHAPADGDTLFALATGSHGHGASPALVGTMAAEASARTVVQAPRHATALGACPATRDLGAAHHARVCNKRGRDAVHDRALAAHRRDFAHVTSSRDSAQAPIANSTLSVAFVASTYRPLRLDAASQ